MDKKRILIVEDSRGDVQFWIAMLDSDVQCVHANTIEIAKDMFAKDQNFNLVVMDCCVPGSEPNTMDLVRWIRKGGYIGPILANSSIVEFTNELVKAGASHECIKGDVIENIKRILGLS